MITGKLLTSNSAPSVIEYVGSVELSANTPSDWSGANDLDVLSIAQPNDLVVLAFSVGNVGANTFEITGMTMTPRLVGTTSGNELGCYVGHKIVSPTDSNPRLTGSYTDWRALSIVASVFRRVPSFVNIARTLQTTGTYILYSASGTVFSNVTATGTGMPNPPSLTAAGRLWVSTGHIDDDVVTDWSAPANYTLAESVTASYSGSASSTAIAYRIEELASDDPATFGGSGDDDWISTTIAFS